MNNNNRKVEPFTLWRHFKGGKVIVLFIAKHSETGEDLVIYRCINKKEQESNEFYARPLNMFLSEVDHEKYPEITQKYRLEKIED